MILATREVTVLMNVTLDFTATNARRCAANIAVEKDAYVITLVESVIKDVNLDTEAVFVLKYVVETSMA